MGALSRLDAVNEMLLQSGEALVSDLDEQSGVDTSIAQYILDQKITEFAMRGIAQNMATREFTPDVDGRLHLPVDILSARIIKATGIDKAPISEVVNNIGNNLVIRGLAGSQTPYIHDLSTGSDWFGPDVKVTVNLIFSIDFEDMDISLQKAVVYQAARTYQMLSQGDAAADQYLSQMENYYEGKAKGMDNTMKNRNVLNTSPTYRAVARKMMGRTFPDNRRYWRND